MILVDDRAGSQQLVNYPPLDDPDLATLCRLDSADVCFSGNGPDGTLLVGVECKSITDLLQSAGNGRLQATQLPAMLAAYQSCWLLLYGAYRPGGDGQLQLCRYSARRNTPYWANYELGGGKRLAPYTYLEGLLFDIALLGFHVKHVAATTPGDVLGECAQWLAALHKWFSKPWDKHHAMRTFDRSQDVGRQPGLDERTQRCAEVAARLPGLGYSRAMAAAKHFDGSIRAMVNAEPGVWAAVPGVGKVLSKAVVAAVK